MNRQINDLEFKKFTLDENGQVAVRCIIQNHADEKVKADSTDSTAGYLSDKVDGDTLEVDTTTHKMKVKSGVFAPATHNHDSRYYTKTETDNLLSDKEDKANKVSSWQTTPDNTHYPTEKLVKDNLDNLQTQIDSNTSDISNLQTNKANDNEVVHLTGTETITGKKTFNNDVDINGDLNLNGNLNIEGDLNYVNTQNLQVEDKVIILDKGGTNADGSGLEVEENGSIVASLKYNEGDNRWNDGVDNLARVGEITDLDNNKANKDLSNVSNTDFLNKIKAVDGSGSGIDADLLDGHNSDYFAVDSNVVHKTGDETINGRKIFNERIYINSPSVFQVWTETDTAVDAGGLRRFVNDGGVFRIDRNTAAAGDFSTYEKDFIIDNKGDIKINKNIIGNGIGVRGGTNTFGSQLRGTYIAPPLYGEWACADNSTFYNVGDILAYGIDKGELEVIIKDKDGNDITPSNIRDVFRDTGYIKIDNVSDISPLTVEIKRINGSNIGSIRELILLYAFRDSYIKTGKVEVEQDGNNDGTYDWDTVLNIDNADRTSTQVIPVGRWRIRTIKITVNEVGSLNSLRLRNIIGIYIADSTNSYWLSRDGGSVYGNVDINGDLRITNGIIDFYIHPGRYWDGTKTVYDNNWVQLDIPGTKNLNISDNLLLTDGKLGIGTTNPTEKLVVVGDKISYNYFTNTTDRKLLIGSRYELSGITHSNKGHYLQVLWGDLPQNPENSSSDGGWGLLFGSMADPFLFMCNHNVGIGTTNPSSKLTVAGGDIETTDSGKGLILKGEDGNRYRLKVNSNGELELESL